MFVRIFNVLGVVFLLSCVMVLFCAYGTRRHPAAMVTEATVPKRTAEPGRPAVPIAPPQAGAAWPRNMRAANAPRAQATTFLAGDNQFQRVYLAAQRSKNELLYTPLLRGLKLLPQDREDFFSMLQDIETIWLEKLSAAGPPLEQPQPAAGKNQQEAEFMMRMSLLKERFGDNFVTAYLAYPERRGRMETIATIDRLNIFGERFSEGERRQLLDLFGELGLGAKLDRSQSENVDLLVKRSAGFLSPSKIDSLELYLLGEFATLR